MERGESEDRAPLSVNLPETPPGSLSTLLVGPVTAVAIEAISAAFIFPSSIVSLMLQINKQTYIQTHTTGRKEEE